MILAVKSHRLGGAAYFCDRPACLQALLDMVSCNGEPVTTAWVIPPGERCAHIDCERVLEAFRGYSTSGEA